MIRILVVDDLAAVRTALRLRLSAEPDMKVVGEASDGEAGLAMAALLCPEIVLMDIQMPHMDGISAARALRESCPEVAVVMLSIQDDRQTRAQVQEAGAAAFVAKSASPSDLVTAIRQAAHSHPQNPASA